MRCSSDSPIAPGASSFSPRKKRGCSTTTTSAPSTSSSGLIHEGEGVAAEALEVAWTSRSRPSASRSRRSSARAQAAPTGHIPFTPRAKKVLELSLREALQLGHNYIGTEHILLGLIREGEGVAAQVLQKLGADLNRVRQTVIQLLSDYTGGEGAGLAAGGSTEQRGQGSAVLDQFGRNLTQLAGEASSIRSSVVRKRSSGSCRCSRVAPRTTLC